MDPAQRGRGDLGPGDVLSIPSGDDWVVGDDPVVVIDFHGASAYAKGG